MSIDLARIQADALEEARRALHVDQGEPGLITLIERDRDTNELFDLVTIYTAWNYSEVDYLNRDRLPNDVDYELRVSELNLRPEELRRGVAFRHGRKIFQVVRRPFPPSASIRFWRFHLLLSETTAE